MAADSPGKATASDEEFERALLASVNIDDPPSGAAKLALARFVRSAATVTALEPTALRGAAPAARSFAKWLSVGALVGCAVVAAYFEGAKHAATTRSSSPPPSTAASLASAPVPSVGSVPGNLQEPTTPTEVSRPPDARAASRVAAPRAARLTLAPRAASSASLAEEVARLDAARTALDIGDFDGASHLLERYELDFPNGALAREADVMAVRALSAKGDGAGALRRARRFLVSYPHDLHAARVKELVSWQGLDANE